MSKPVFAWGVVVLATSTLFASPPPLLPEVPSREVEVTAVIGDLSAPDRGLVALSDGSGMGTILVREAGHLRAQKSVDGGTTYSTTTVLFTRWYTFPQ